MKHVFLILICAGLLFGCDSESLVDDRSPVEDGVVKIGDYRPDNLEGDPFELLGAEIVSNRLILDVAYSGGCAEHDFAGFTPEVNIAIFPPQITVFVVHDGNGDLCEAYPRENVELDISSLLGAFGNEFSVTILPIESGSQSIVLHHDS
jgi:hypothetical protein